MMTWVIRLLLIAFRN